MPKLVDMIGKRFGRWTVLERSTKTDKAKNVYYRCRCDCGKEKDVLGTTLRNGKSVSCGCYQKQVAHENTKHGLTNTRLYKIWENMVQRCTNPKSDSYYKYGARGIKLCDKWRKDFLNFYQWAINNGYQDDLTIDRIDNNGNYEPSNCRWATPKEQAQNTRVVRLITINGETHCFRDWSKILKIPYSTLHYRWKKQGII